MLKNLYILLVIFCAYSSFTLLPFSHIAGVFNLKDVGNALIWVAVVVLLVTKKQDIRKLNNPISWFIFVYFMMIALQAIYATMFYGQPLLSGFIMARHQLYYGSFFLFLLVLDTREAVDRLMAYLVVLCLMLMFLTLVNYFGPTIFHHKWAEGHGIRSGITRAMVPGLSLMLLVGLWHLVRFLKDQKSTIWSLTFFLLSYSFIIFRQTRGRIINFTLIILIFLFTQKKFKALAALLVVFTATVSILSFAMEENILLSPFESTFAEVSENAGTWEARTKQIAWDWIEIKKHPIIGNAGLVLRGGKDSIVDTAELAMAAYGADLGYTHWIKFFGLTGFTWMLLFYITVIKKLRRLRNTPGTESIMLTFSTFMSLYICLAEVTLDFFTSQTGILILCMTMAIMLNSEHSSPTSKTVQG